MPTVTPQFEFVNQIVAFVTLYGVNVLGGIIILFVGFWIAGRVEALVDRALGRIAAMDVTLRRFAARLVRYLILAFTALSVLARFGVETTSLIAVFGAAGLAIGLALQGTLSHLAAGVMLLLFRPFRVGDQITVAGHTGEVRTIDLFMTELATADNSRVLVPNGAAWGSAIVNSTYHPIRAIELKVPIAADVDLAAALAVLRALAADDARVLAEPPPRAIAVGQPAAEVAVELRAWCKTADFGALRADLIAAVRAALPTLPKRG